MIIQFTAEAERDLDDIAHYIAADNPARAVSFLAELRARCHSLAAFPKRFPLVSRYARHGIRQCVHGNYRIFYRIEKQTITVIHILHGAMDDENILS
ncbi:type II toxin-antitoxin system RelE/ParE family toxin [Blastomonas sp.]|uniref:type II toxin-antitoxin system RelE/ParE family toxin n=1 Tax=Blastomonas sp. TaxID=1909299 RepID=UPI00391AC45D